MASIREIAELAGVSRGTVDRVLNNRGSVRPSSEARVREVIERIQYKPNRAGQMLSACSKKLKLGLLLGDFKNLQDLVGDAQKEMEQYSASGVEFVMRTVYAWDSPGLVAALDEIIASDVNGLIIMSMPFPELLERLKNLEEKNMAIISLFFYLPGVNCIATVDTDYAQVAVFAADAMRVLLHGKGQVVVAVDQFQERHQRSLAENFQKRMMESAPGITILPPLNLVENRYKSYNSALEYLKREKDLEGIFIVMFDDSGLLHAINDSGLKDRLVIVNNTSNLFIEPVRSVVSDIILNTPFRKTMSTSLRLLYNALSLNDLPTPSKHYLPVSVQFAKTEQPFETPVWGDASILANP